MPTDRLLTPPETAAIVRCSVQALADWRHDGSHPNLSKPVEEGGAVARRGRRVFYLESLVLKFAGLATPVEGG